MKTRPTSRVLAVLAICTGLILLLEGYGYLSGIYRLWPLFPFILGTGFIFLFLRNRSDTTIVVVGTYLVCASILFFVLNFTTWALLADLWPLFIGFLGLSFLTAVIWGGKRGVFILISFFLILLCGVFLLVFTVDSRLWPITLVLFGACLLLIGRFDRKELTRRMPESVDG